MEVILIACCDRKIHGGSTVYDGSLSKSNLTIGTFQHLMNLRRVLSGWLGEEPGPDLGGRSNHSIEYLPAL